MTFFRLKKVEATALTTNATKTKRIIMKIGSVVSILFLYFITIINYYFFIHQNDNVVGISNQTNKNDLIESLLLQHLGVSFSKTTLNVTKTTINNKNNEKGMYAIVHIGPPKTGTTTLQNMMKRLRNELDIDQYQLPNYYPGQKANLTNMIVLTKCLEGHTSITYEFKKLQRYCDPKIILHIIHIASRNKHLLISSERFSLDLVQPKLLYTLLSPYHTEHNMNNQIKIVIYYRRFFEWMISYNNEMNERSPVYNRQSIYDWIHDENKIQSLLDNRYITGCYKRYLQYFHNSIQIVNMHEMNHNLIENFFCNVLINANQTCQKVHHMENDGILNNDEIKNKNTFKPLIYEELVYAAVQMNLINSSSSLSLLQKQNKKGKGKMNKNNNDNNNNPLLSSKMIELLSYKARQYQENTLLLNENNFTQLKCPNNTLLDHILQITLDAESSILPQFYQKDSITNHFNYMKHKLCIVDVQYIISNNINGWKTFFMSL